MTIRVLSASDLDRALAPADAVEAMRTAFGELSGGTARVPVRGSVESELGVTLLMPAYLGASRALGAKVVSVFPENEALPAIHGAVLVIDPNTGRPLALLDGTRLTALRTAAGSALATELLAAPDPDVLAVFGAGAQGRSHIEVIAATRRLREIRIVSRDGASARRLASEAEGWLDLLPPDADGPRPEVRPLTDANEAIDGASIIVAATTSATPVFDGSRVAAGTHVNGVGSFRPDIQEIDVDVVRRARVVVDQRAAAWEEAGDLIVPLRAGEIGDDIIDAELGEIVNGSAPRGRAGHELTFFKSVGNAAQDVAIAALALERAQERDLGSVVPF